MSEYSGDIDIVALDVSSDTSQVTVRIGLRDLSRKDPRTTVGVQYDVRAVVAMKRIHFDAIVDVTGTSFYAFAEDLGESTGEPETVQMPGTTTAISGRIDTKNSTVTLTAPLKVFGFRYPLQLGRELKSWVSPPIRWQERRPAAGRVWPVTAQGRRASTSSATGPAAPLRGLKDRGRAGRRRGHGPLRLAILD